jgi:hypothetical protein
MELSRELRSLAESGSWGAPMVSVYADTRWRDESQRERVRIFWSNARHRARADGVPEAALRPVDTQIESIFRRGSGVPAVAMFSGVGRFRMLGLPRGVGQLAYWDERPALLPLARAVSISERALAVSIGAKASRLFELEGPLVRADIEILRDDFPGRHERGGFAQPRMQRHVREHIRWELDSVLRALVEFFDREPCRVFVFGTPQLNGMFGEILPQRVRARAVMLEALGGDPQRAQYEVVERVDAFLEREHRVETYELERRIYQEAMAGREGVLGAENVLLALAEGRIHELLLKDGFECYGAECLQCGALDIKRLTGCSYCGGSVRLGNLAEAIVNRAVRAGTQVRFMPASGRHGGVGGIAALLRPTRGPGWQTLGRENHLDELAIGPRA